jgi:alkanesulfonate monooxygenase SsuD/methylene tetrahydromethanopterin reductase-like flavin-dependent oxidoreductase (luciferase family)
VRFGLALPHYDFSLLDEAAEGRPLRFETILEVARRAEDLGFDSLWVSDHLSLSVEKYGGGPGEWFAYEPLTLLAALARHVSRPRLGTLVLCEALRPAAVAVKALTTLDHLCDGRLDIGIGAGWYEPDYQALGMDLPPPATRLARLDEALAVFAALFPGDPTTVEGRFHRVRGACNRPPARQSPRPPVFVGGKGNRLLELVAWRAEGWNTCWVWTPAAYRERAAALERACEAVGRDPATVYRSLGLYTLVGKDGADLERRFERMRRLAPGGMLAGTSLEEWREGRLVGTVDEVREQVALWGEAGVEELICAVGPLPFSISATDDLEAAAAGLGAPDAR